MAATAARAGLLALYDAGDAALRILAQVGYPPDLAAHYRATRCRCRRGVVGRAVRRA